MSMACYRFVSNEVFYIITGTPWFERYALYFPKTDIIVYLTDTPVALKPTPEKLNEFKAYVVTFWKQIYSYWSNLNDPQLVAVFGFINNIGHQLWNELSGIQNISDYGALHKIDKFSIVGFEFFGKIEEIFPEISANKIERIDPEQLSYEILEKNHFSLRLGHCLIQN